MPKEFDPDLSPTSEHNRDVAVKQKLRYDSAKNAYVDADGSIVRDKFGQPL